MSLRQDPVSTPPTKQTGKQEQQEQQPPPHHCPQKMQMKAMRNAREKKKLKLETHLQTSKPTTESDP